MSHVVGIFDSTDAAARAERVLADAGFPPERVVRSHALTDDDQSFGNHPGQPPEDSEFAAYEEAARGGGCILSVAVHSDAERVHLSALLKRHGARRVAESPA